MPRSRPRLDSVQPKLALHLILPHSTSGRCLQAASCICRAVRCKQMLSATQVPARRFPCNVSLSVQIASCACAWWHGMGTSAGASSTSRRNAQIVPSPLLLPCYVPSCGLAVLCLSCDRPAAWLLYQPNQPKLLTSCS